MQSSSRPARVAVVGATGYGGAELLRHLLFHPHVEVVRLVAKDHIGARIDDVHLSLAGSCDLRVEDLEPEDAVAGVDLVFLGLPHRVSAPVVARYADLGVKVIDLAGDYRLADAATYARYYEAVHPHPERLGTFAYGLPELFRDEIRGARLVSSPGCFATLATLCLAPFAGAALVAGRVQMCAMTGSSGSGANPTLGTHHPLRAGTLRPYKPLGHQHTPEIVQNLRRSGGGDVALDFVPVSAPLVRGILATCFFEVDADADQARLDHVLRDAYNGEPLIRLVAGRLPQTGAVAGSMSVELAVTCGEDVRDGRRPVVVHGAIDNLVKGGAGQAVQSMNLVLGVDELTGLSAPGLWP